MSFAPAVPLAGYLTAPSTEPLPEDAILSLLPPLNKALNQLILGQVLGGVYYTRLGYYPDDYFSNKDVNAALATFQERLGAIENQIKESGSSGTYPFLLPSRIPQSINI